MPKIQCSAEIRLSVCFKIVLKKAEKNKMAIAECMRKSKFYAMSGREKRYEFTDKL